MRRLLSSALLFSLAACSSTPAPAVQSAPAPTTTEPTTTAVADAAVPDAAVAAAADASAAPSGALNTDLTVTMPDAGATPVAVTPPAHPAVAAAGNEVARGHAVFEHVCARCHEDNDPDGPSHNKRWAEARMRNLIRSGNARMRAIPVARMSDDDLVLLVSYLRSTRAIQ